MSEDAARPDNKTTEASGAPPAAPAPVPSQGNMPPMRPPFQGPRPGLQPLMGAPRMGPGVMGPGPGMFMPPGGPASVGMPTPPMGSVMMRPPNMPPAPGPGGPGGPGPMPMVDQKGEMWMEHKAPDGRPYFGNVRTGETTWTRPEPADPNKPPPPVPTNGPPPPGAMPNGPPPGPPGGPPPVGGPPQGMMPPPMGGMPPPPMGGMPPPGMPMQMPMGGPPMMMHPGGRPPMQMMPPGPGGPMMGRPPFPGGPPPGGNMPMPPVQARVWSEHKHPDGRTYFYNRITMKSEWKKPEDFDTAMAPAGQVPIPPAAAPKTDTDGESKKDDEKGTSEELEDAKSESGDGKEEKMDAEDKEEDEEEKKPSEPTRPIATKPVPGHAPWVIVFTSDDRVFFFNQSNSQSVWSVPEELASIDNLDELMKTPRQRAEEEASRRTAERESLATKRPADTSDEPAAKKPAIDPALDPEEDGLTIEQRAQRLRASLTVDERQRRFKEMLAEKKVSAFSTWEKELTKLVCDIRYLLLSAKERKVAFDQYLRTRAEEERKEKKTQHKGKRVEFRALLEEANISAKSSFSDFAMKYGREKRFKSVEKMREREAIFNDYIDELKAQQQKRKAEEASATEKSCSPAMLEREFFDMLKEDTSLTHKSHWRKVKDDFKDDDRYQAIDGSEQREELFRKYRQGLIDEKEAAELREREREERIAASIKERARQVEKARSEQQREVEIGRSHHIKEEAEQAMKALLADLVRDGDTDWSSAVSVLRRDHRWNNLDALSKDKKEQIFTDHCNDLRIRKRAFYTRILNDIPGLTLATTWKEVKRATRSDAKYDKLHNDPNRKEEFARFMQERTVAARDSYRKLLQETRVITHKSRKLWDRSDSHRKEILTQLEKDNRHLIMDSVSEERESLLLAYMRDLEDRGPPPPPTASDSSARIVRRPNKYS